MSMTKIKSEEWVELYSELASYVENKLFPDRKTHNDDGSRIEYEDFTSVESYQGSTHYCQICDEVEEILSRVLVKGE
tara:strand:+ start:1888 stop:2118 length:231 start_codon:yes stop_codon:yes gene_type:complete